MNWFLDPVKNKYADFSGRATRQEYWMFVLVYILIYVALLIVDTVLGLNSVLASVFALIIFVPSIAINARRLHDIDKSGWWQLINFVPLVGLIVLIYFLVQKGEPGANQYGVNPAEGEAGDGDIAAAAAPIATPTTPEAGADRVAGPEVNTSEKSM